MSAQQLTLIEPTGREAIGLAQEHFKRADNARRVAAVWQARGFSDLHRAFLRVAADHEAEGNALGMLAELEAMAGLS